MFSRRGKNHKSQITNSLPSPIGQNFLPGILDLCQFFPYQTRIKNQKFQTLELAHKEAERRNRDNFSGRVIGFWEARPTIRGDEFIVAWADFR